MWPGKKNVGPQLTYGVNGSPVVSPGPTSATTEKFRLRFPRLLDSGPELHQIHNSTVRISPKYEANPAKLRHSHGAASANLYEEFAAPTSLLDAVDGEARPLHEPQAHDPSRGPLSATFLLGTGAYSEPIIIKGKPYHPKAKTSMISVRCHAFASDPYTLKVVPMVPKNRNFLHTKTPKLSRKAVFAVPDTHKYFAECVFPFEIQQIEVCRDHKLLAVRGLQHIAFVAIDWQNQPGKKGLELLKAFTILHQNAELLHMATTRDRFVIVDSEGTYLVYSFWLRDHWEYEQIHTGKLPKYDPTDGSNWRRLCWPPASDSFYYFSRKSASKIDYKASSTQKLITFHVWSRAQDFALFGRDLFLLTSQEIIWVHILPDGSFTRKISWKHYLDDQDVTLKLSAFHCEVDDLYVCLVYSESSPVVLSFTFAIRDGMPCSLRDPYILPTQSPRRMFLSIFESPRPDNDSIWHVSQMDPNYCSTLTSYCKSEDRAFRNDRTEPKPAEAVPTAAPWKLGVDMSRNVFRFLVRSFEQAPQRESQKMVEDVPSNSQNSQHPLNQSSQNSQANSAPGLDPPEETPQCDLVQDYAFELGTDIKAFFEPEHDSQLSLTLLAHRSLTDIAENVPFGITDFAELESMLAQLARFYESQGVALLPFDHQCLQGCDLGASPQNGSIKQIPQVLEKYAGTGKSEAAVALMASLVKAHGDFLPEYADCLGDEINGFPEPLLEMIDEWKIDLPSSAQNGTKTPSRPAMKVNGGRKNGLLRRALTQNSQLMADSQDHSQNGQASQLFVSQDDEDSEIPFLQVPNTQEVFPDISSSPPGLVVATEESVKSPERRQKPERIPKTQKSPAAIQSQRNTQSIGSSQPETRANSQKVPSSQTPSNSQKASQSIKRPGTQPTGKKKKKVKGGFA